MAKIQIIVGSVNGTAHKTAMAVAHVLNHQGHDAWVNLEPNRDALEKDSSEALLVCCSTTGEGELPRNIYPVYLALDDQAVDIKDRKYGVIALGDSGYTYFALAGFMMENVFYLSGAKRVGEVLTLDAKKVTNPSLEAAQWATEWVENIA
ncbi:MAG: flavodoxin domain-containing protein [Gammaproteobacteria bacterium]